LRRILCGKTATLTVVTPKPVHPWFEATSHGGCKAKRGRNVGHKNIAERAGRDPSLRRQSQRRKEFVFHLISADKAVSASALAGLDFGRWNHVAIMLLNSLKFNSFAVAL
jgi:hypothetical protein